MYMKMRVVIQVEWAHASQYAVRGRRWIDCIGRVVDATERSGDRESTLSEFRRDPISHSLGIIIFHDKLDDLCPFASGKGFELLDNFSATHGEKNISPN